MEDSRKFAKGGFILYLKLRDYHILEGERLNWQKVKMRSDDIVWIEEAAKELEQEPIRLEFLGEALVA